MICPIETDEGNGNGVVLRCGGDEIFAVEWRVTAGTLALKRLSHV